RDSRAPLRRRRRARAHRGGCGRTRRRAEMGAGAWRRALSPPPWAYALERGAMGKGASACSRWAPCPAGACATMGLLGVLAHPLMGLMEAELAHRFAVNALKWAPLPPSREEDALLA